MIPVQPKWSLYWLARHKPYGIVLLTGFLLAGSFPPSPLNFLIFIAFVPLFVLFETEVVPERVPEDQVFRPFKSFFVVMFRLFTLQFIWRRKTRSARVFSYRRKLISGNAQLYRYTYVIFLMWNLLCCYWLTFTSGGGQTIREVLVSITAGILAILINPALMSIPFQFFSRIRWIMAPWMAALSLVVFWLTFEYLHLHWDLSWSWLNLGHALSPHPDWVQYAEWTGTLGITAHILITNVLIYLFYRRWTHRQKQRWAHAGIALTWLFLPLMLQPLILDQDREVFQEAGELQVRIVQPSMDPYMRGSYLTPEAQVNQLFQLSLAQPLDSIDLLIFPEAAVPRLTDEALIPSSRLLAPLWTLVDSFELSILTGMETFQVLPSDSALPESARMNLRGEWIDQYNSAVMLSPGRSVSVYHKEKLIPMVERIPFLAEMNQLGNLIPPIGPKTISFGHTNESRLLWTADSIPMGSMICYDSEFGASVGKSSREGAEMLTILTNDAWWGNTSGYIQHAYLSSLRAIENRRAIARAANTGRSLFVDACGYRYQESGWWETTTLDRSLKRYRGTTFYARNGDYIGQIAGYLTLILTVLGIAWNNYLRWKRGPRRIISSPRPSS